MLEKQLPGPRRHDPWLPGAHNVKGQIKQRCKWWLRVKSKHKATHKSIFLFYSHISHGWYLINHFVSKRANPYYKEIKVRWVGFPSFLQLMWTRKDTWKKWYFTSIFKAGYSFSKQRSHPIRENHCEKRHKGRNMQACPGDRDKGISKLGSCKETEEQMVQLQWEVGGSQKLQRNIRKVNHEQQIWSKSPQIRWLWQENSTTCKFTIAHLLIFQESSRKTIKPNGQNIGLKGKTQNLYLWMCNSKDEWPKLQMLLFTVKIPLHSCFMLETQTKTFPI